tara:strand:- start:5242 stop:5697 length:456 start_codon:yes stop_codon:yes gene_type:complete
MAFKPAVLNDVKQVEPNIDELGILNIQNEIDNAATDVLRDLQTRWWPTSNLSVYDITRLGTGAERMNSDQLNATQWTKCTVFRALGFHIFPKLAKFDQDQDMFERKMEFYRREYERELDDEMRFGVAYDSDSSGTFSDTEKEATISLRLKR